MCGIVGTWGEFSKEEGLSRVHRMLQKIEHRGPDDFGTWSTNNFAFGMRRLSIVDIAGGAQPKFEEDGVSIVFNGEIYNFRELRTELVKKGCNFKSQSDTEVVLHLYRTEGLEGLKKLHGMYAVCLYDPRQKKVHLIRDRMGIKPLYFAHCTSIGFYFASEVKALISVLPKKPEINTQSLSHYLTLRYVPGEATIWNGIYRLPPGNTLSLDIETGHLSRTVYWEPHFEATPYNKQRDYLGEFTSLFLSAVESHLVTSDVPVGIFLSGGLDSSAVAAASLELGHKNLHTFNVAFDEGGEFSEQAFAKKMAETIHSQHHEILISQSQFLHYIEDFVYDSDEPLADLASVPLYYLSKLARDHVKVVLSGEGSDEILAGYDMKRLNNLLEVKRSALDFLPHHVESWLSHRYPLTFNWKDTFRLRQTHITRCWDDDEKERLLKFKAGTTASVLEQLYSKATSDEPLDQLQEVYCRSWLVEDLLMKADKMTMANSLELRVPFLDYSLVEWAMRSPLEVRAGKKILRQFCQGRVPNSIIHRPKRGFPVPAYQWLKGALGRTIQSELASRTCKLTEYLEMDSVGPTMEKARHGDNSAAHKIWTLWILEKWMHKWL